MSDQSRETRASLLFNRFQTNLHRTANLMKGCKKFPTRNDSQVLSPLGEDIIRAAFVFLHASLEDFLRGIGRLLLPDSPEESLKQVRFYFEGNKSTDKITLAAVARHRDLSVREFVEHTVNEWLDRHTFNSSTQIMTFLHLLPLSTDKLEETLQGIDTLVNRRHKIVHNTDITSDSEVAPPEMTIDDPRQLALAFWDVDVFASIIVAQIMEANEAGKVLERVKKIRDLGRDWVYEHESI